MKKTAIVFPGQGSQVLGMLMDIAAHYPAIIHAIFTEASSVLNYDLWELTSVDPHNTLNQTEYAQPAILTASYAIWRIIQTQHRVTPAVMAGHSLGEYTALVCAEAMAFKDAVKLVEDRGKYMQSAVNAQQGGMAAIVGLSDQEVLEICQKSISSNDQILSPANYNSVGQVVIAGHIEPLMKAIDFAKAAGAKLAKQLPVSVPSHCALMQKAASQLSNRLDKINFSLPKIPVINNVDALPYQTIEAIQNGLVRQMISPVRWVGTVYEMEKMGIEVMIECGPQKVLTNLSKRIITNDSVTFYSTGDWLNLSNFLNNITVS